MAREQDSTIHEPRGEPGTFAYRYDSERLKTATDWPVTVVQVARWIVTDPSGFLFIDDVDTPCIEAESLPEFIDAWGEREAFEQVWECTPEEMVSDLRLNKHPRYPDEGWAGLSGHVLCSAVGEYLEISDPVIPISWEDAAEREQATKTWETHRVFLFADEAKEWAEARKHRWPDGWRTYTLPARGDLRTLLEAAEQVGGLQAFPLQRFHFAEGRPGSVWWCNTCPGPVCVWGGLRTPPPRCPECHGVDFYPLPGGEPSAWSPISDLPPRAGWYWCCIRRWNSWRSSQLDGDEGWYVEPRYFDGERFRGVQTGITGDDRRVDYWQPIPQPIAPAGWEGSPP